MLKEIHDQLLLEKPESVEHVPEDCPHCNGLEISEADDNGPQGGSTSVKTYTEDEYNSLLAQVATLEAKVTELAGARQESEIESKIAEIKAQSEDQIAELQTKLDTAVLETEAAKNENEKVLAYFKGLEEEAAKAAETAQLRDERIALVKEHTSFPETRIAERAEAWAAMTEADFAAALEDWKTIAPKSEDGETVIPVATAMTASRQDQSGSNVLRDVLGLRFKGIDPRNVPTHNNGI